MRAVTEIVDQSARKRQVINDLLVCPNGGRWRCETQTRRSRIAAEHRVCPVDTRVENGDVHPLALITLVKCVKGRKFLKLAVNEWSTNIIDALFEIDVQRGIRLDLFDLGHRSDRAQRSRRDLERHPI